ncbi:MAG: hypothetical protein M3008_00115 [Chloroflexota bacterium]|nr:hypothetical protein [Chloroflexota bacterium]
MGKTGKVTANTATATGESSGTAKRTTTPRKSDATASPPLAGEQLKSTASAPKAAPAAAKADEQSATAHAEEVFDDAGQRVGQFALIAGQYLRQFTARAREEAEDIWVEAQNVRGKKP